jgi:MFS family permease
MTPPRQPPRRSDAAAATPVQSPGTGGGAPPSGTRPSGAWRVLALLAVAQLLGMSVWFTAGAVGPRLAQRWALDTAAASWLVSAVQLGFVAGTALAAVLNLADVVPARRYFAVSGALAAAANGALLIAPGFEAALVTRFLTGFFLAGVYPPAMKMAATWFRSGRGLAIGVIVGALTVGKAFPYLVGAFAVLNPSPVVVTGSIAALVAAAIVGIGYRDGPFGFERRAFSWSLVGTVLGERRTRLAIGAYLGHMWELYAMWAALSLFFLHFFSAKGYATVDAALFAGLGTFAAIAAGGAGSVLAGAWADRVGRENIAAAAMAVSGACALTIGWLEAAPAALVVTLALVWGFAVVADSAQFSVLVTEVAPPHAVGTALTLQTSLGFLLTAGTIWGTFAVQQALGWGVAFSLLAIGPAAGILAILRLRSVRGGRVP